MSNQETKIKPNPTNWDKDREKLEKPLAPTIDSVKSGLPDASDLTHRQREIGPNTVVDVYQTRDNHLTFNVTRAKDSQVKVDPVKGFHYLIKGNPEDVIAMATPDPIHGHGFLLEIDGEAKRVNHLGPVDVFDAKTQRPLGRAMRHLD